MFSLFRINIISTANRQTKYLRRSKLLQHCASMSGLSNEEALNACTDPYPQTKDYIMQQTMYRIRDPKVSLDFYTRIMGMRLLKKLDFPEMKFSLYFMGYEDAKDIPLDENERTRWMLSRKATIELTHNWGTERDGFKYHNGNTDPRGFGHIGVMVPNVDAACERFDQFGVRFVKRPNEGKMMGIAFILDPDDYWIEILNCNTMADSNGGIEIDFEFTIDFSFILFIQVK